jgi:hypothetical protein
MIVTQEDDLLLTLIIKIEELISLEYHSQCREEITSSTWTRA